MNKTLTLSCALAALLCAAAGGAQEAALVSEPGTTPEEQAPEPAEKIMLNFRGASLDAVLDYLSVAAGFIIVREVEVSGTVTVWSHRPLGPDEAVALLNTILGNRGYAAIRQGRTLTIVDRESAKERGIPVRMGSDPGEIPATDEMVTQIIPVRYADVKQLLENIKELLPSYAVATVNQSTNAIVLTDTQANVHRMAEIVTALDDSISGITEMKVFHLNNAAATDTAKLINDVFEVKDTGQSADSSNRDGRRDFFSRMRGGPPGMDGGGGDSSGSGQSPARRAASNVVAVADERSNSVVVGAPGDMMPLVEALVEELDGLPEELPVMRVFPLKYADAEEMADLINDLFNPTSSNSRTGNSGSQRIAGDTGGRRSRGGMLEQMMARMQGQRSQGEQRTASTEESTVQAIADLRTNSVVVTAVRESMAIVEEMVEQLDANPAKDRKVFVYSLENADAEEVAEILQQTFQSSTSGGNTNRSNNTNSSRQTNQNRNSNNTQRNTGR
jgi:general secretion pathway protein D